MKININCNKVLEINFIITLFVILYNFYIRYATLRIITEYEKIILLFLFILLIICSFYVSYTKTIITFVFGFSFFLFGFRPYDVQSQIFETLVLLVTIYYFVENYLHNNSKTINKSLRNLFTLIIILSTGSLLLLPIKYILYNFMSLGKEWFLYQIVNVHPNSFFYPLNGVNKLILFFTFSVVMAQNSLKLFRVFFLGLIMGGIFCSIIGIIEYYGVISLTWYSNTVTPYALSSTFLNRGWFAEYLILVSPFIFVLFKNFTGTWVRMILLGILVFFEITLLLVGARAGWVTYPLVLLLCWLFLYFVEEGKVQFSKLKWHSYLKILISVPLSILISLAVLFYLVFPSTEFSTDKSIIQSGQLLEGSRDYIQYKVKKLFDSKSRVNAWMQGIDAGMENPIFGLGYDSFAWHTSILSKIPESRYSREISNKFKYLFDTPHNLYIHIFVNIGIVGVTIWLMFILYCLILLFYDLIKNHNLTNIPILIAMVTFHIYGIFQSMQYVPMIWFFIFFCIAYCLRIPNDLLPKWIKNKVTKINKYISIIVLIGIFNYAYKFESKHIAKKYNLAKYEYDQNYNKYMGLYPVENWKGENYRWTGSNAEIKLRNKGSIGFKIQYHNTRPDLKPAKIEISIDGVIIKKIFFNEKSKIITKDIILDLGKSDEEKIVAFSISRTWSPKNFGSKDERYLGFAISDIKPLNI